MRRNLPSIIILLCAFLASLTIYFFRSKKVQTENHKIYVDKNIKNLISSPIKYNLSDSVINWSNGSKFLTDAGGTKQKYFFVLITQGDCFDCYKDIGFWNSLQDYSDNLKPFVVIRPSEMYYMKEFIKSQGIDLPVLVDQEGNLFEVLDRIPGSYTPLCLFADSIKIYSVTNSNYGIKDDQNRFIKFVESNL